MRYLIIPLMLLTGCVAPPPRTSVSVGVSAPGVHMAINLPAYPDMAPVPGYPVYYAPGLGYNYFFYDGLYWVYYGDYWYSSTWYNGPWDSVHPYYVPEFILRVPVRYYRVPPPYFRAWQADAAPRWGERWGRDWDQRRGGWDRWDRRAEPARAPLPHYQRAYPGQRYPQADQQRQLSRDNYRYQPGDSMVRERESGRDRRDQRAPAPGMREQPGNAPNIGNMPPQMRRDEGQREQPGNAPNIGNMPPQMRRDEGQRVQPGNAPNIGTMPPQMQRDEGQRPAAAPAPSRAPVIQEPQRREPQHDAQTRGQPPGQMEAPARSRDRDDRRGGDRGNDRRDDRDNDRRGDRNNDSNGDRHNDRRSSGDRNR